MFDILWQSGVRSTTATVRTVHSTIARRWSSNSPSKGAGPWPGSLRQPQPATQLRIFSYEWLRNRGQVKRNNAVGLVLGKLQSSNPYQHQHQGKPHQPHAEAVQRS